MWILSNNIRLINASFFKRIESYDNLVYGYDSNDEATWLADYNDSDTAKFIITLISEHMKMGTEVYSMPNQDEAKSLFEEFHNK